MDDFEAQLEALAALQQLQVEKDQAHAIRQSNTLQQVETSRQSFRKSPQVKSDVKKSTAFVKKLKNITTEVIQQCIRDMEVLNLSLYISEIVNSILSISFKATDCTNMVKLCQSLHQKYEEFTEPLVQGLKQALLSISNEDQDVENNKRKRIQIRFMIELFQVGLFTEEEFFMQLMRQLLGKSKTNNPNAKPTADLQGLTVFVKYGSEVLFGFVPKKHLDLAVKAEKTPEDIPVKQFLNPKLATDMKLMLADTYEKLCEHLVKAHKDYRTKENKYEKDKLIHGQLTEQKQQEYENSKKLYERFLSIVTTLSECSNEKMPELLVEKEEEPTHTGGGITVWDGGHHATNTASMEDGGLFGDPETKAFYEDLPDLLSLVPLSVLGLTPEQAKALSEEWAAKKESSEKETGNDQNAEVDDTALATSEGDVDGEADIEEDEANSTTIPVAGTEGGEDSSNKGDKLNTLLNETLFECVNKQKCDEFCVSFCYVNTKAARKKLIYQLNRIPKHRSELAPMFARIVASLSRLFPDLLQGVLEGQRQEFYAFLKVKKTLHIDIKLRNVRYQGEMIKFQLAPPIIAFKIFKLLLAEFTPHNVEMLAMLLETCGRYLYLLPYTHDSLEHILETMLRLRRARYLDIHQQTLLENAYFVVKPPDRSKGKQKKTELTIVQQYTHYLIMQKLEDHTIAIEDVIKSLRRLPWQSEEENILFHVVKASLKLARTKYVAISNLADCLSGLMQTYPNVMVVMVDRIWEEVTRALESPFKREIQRIIGLTKLFGELYNFTAVSSTHLFDLLYFLINYDHHPKTTTVTADATTTATTTASFNVMEVHLQQHGHYLVHDPRHPSELDMPTDLFRAQIICELLNTVGLYFVRGQAKDKLKRFLLYFQRYLLVKQFIPMHIEFAILDTMDQLEELAREATLENLRKDVKGRGNIKEAEITTTEFPRFESYEEVQKVIEAMESIDKAKWIEKQQANGGIAPMEESDHEEGEEEREEVERAKDEAVGEEANEDDESEESEEDDSDEDSDDSDSDSDGSSDSDSESDSDDEEEDDDEEANEDDMTELQAAKMLEKLRIAEEDEEFEKAFKSVIQESVSSVSSKYQDVNRMVIPKVLPKPKNTFHLEEQEEEEEGEKPKSLMPFKLLSRDQKGRIETRQLLVPESNPMAQKVIKAEEQERLERQMLKEKVLQMNSLSAEIEYEGDEGVQVSRIQQREMYITPAGSSTGAGVVIASKGGRGGGAGRGSGARLVPIRADDTRKPADTLNLDEFLAESNAAEIRRLGKKP